MAIKPVEMQSGLGPFSPMAEGIEAASQSFVAGAALIRSSGKIAIAADNPAVADFLGFAMAAASGTTDDRVTFNDCPIGAVIQANLDNESGSNAAGTLALAQTHQFLRVGIANDGTTGRDYLDVAATSNFVLFQILRFVDPIGTVAGRVIARRVA